jgi:uncharacterized protein (TIGR00725 family)
MTERAVAVFGSSGTVIDSPDWLEAVAVGEALARASFAVVTGGYGGTMEAVSLGATRSGGHAIGVTANSLFPGRSGANPYVKAIEDTASLSERIGRMMSITQACIALPGSIGTAAELVLAWNTNHILRVSGLDPIPVAAVGESWAVLRSAVADGLGAIAEDVYWAATGEEAVAWVAERLRVSVELS